MDKPGREWRLVWSDEFDGSRLDTARWAVEEMSDPPNQEAQYYTSRVDDDPFANVYVHDGRLVIEARAERFGKREFTSGRVTTRGKHEFLYGRFEARMKLPSAAATWPAFWLLGSTFAEDGWPLCGEIDIAEGKGRLGNTIFGTIHGGASPERRWSTGREHVLSSGTFHDSAHVVAVEWEPAEIRWFVDDEMYFSVPKPAGIVSNPSDWPFDQGHPFFIVVNLALGGSFDAPHQPAPDMPAQRLLIDYLRVYQRRSGA